MDFMDEGDDEEIFTDTEGIEIDEAEYIFGEQYGFTSEDSNATEANSTSNGETRSLNEFSSVNLTPEQTKLLNEFTLEKIAQEFLSKVGTGDLVTSLNKHWQRFAPICFNAVDNPTKNLIETDSTKILLKPLEIYLCNSMDSEKVLIKLNELEDPPQICGKVFKAGEPSYFCRDCGSDPTCVLCSSCFRKSKHREHRYKMTTSGGGGYCDCGDPEAWKSHPNCELHMPKAKGQSVEESSESYINKLPQDLAQRATELFTYLLEYIFEVMSIENKEDLPVHLKSEFQTDDYVAMLYNDEVHSYEQVVNTLKKVLNVDDRKAFDYASIVDKEGRSAIKRGKKQVCLDIKRNVEHHMGGPFLTPLETKILHHSLVSHQYFAEKILVWLQKICEMSKGLKHLLCKIGLFTKPDSHSFVEKLMLSDSIYWKSARAILHQFYISTFFMDPIWKREFAILYTKNYKLIWRNHVKNQDDTVSLTDLAVQMFTVISLAKYLIANYNLIQTIMDTLIEHCRTNKGKLSFSRGRNRNNTEFKRAQYMLYDLKYCLTAVPDDWNDDLRRNFINGFKTFIEFIKFMHGMDSLKRQTDQHIEYEPEWEASFNLLIKLQKSISSLIEWCSSDRIVYLECYKYLMHSIHQVENTDSLYTYKYDKVKFNGQQFEIIDYAVIKEEVSIHTPLTRLFSAIYSQMQKFNLNFHSIFDQIQSSSQSSLSCLKHDLPKAKMIALIEPSLRALVLVSQTNAGFWKKNGFSLLSQVFFYSNIKCRHEMFDRDILCLQMGASVIDSNEFILNLLHHFGLLEFLTNENFEVSTADKIPDSEKLEYLIPVSEDLLELLIHIISERFDTNLSQIEEIKKLEREVIHQLCVTPMAHSDLVKNIYPDNEKYTNELEAVLNRIAVFKQSPPTSNTKGVYELKEEYQAYYSPYFYHYTRSEKTKSEEYQLNLKKNTNEKYFKPPRLPPLTELFSNISHLLDSDVFIKIIFCILRRVLNKSKLASEGQLIRVLYLIGLALHEEQDEIDKNFQTISENSFYIFKFLEKSILSNKKSSSLFSVKSFKSDDNLIKLLSDLEPFISTESYKLLANWVLEYSQRLLKLKHKIDQQKNLSEDSCKATTSSALSESEERVLKEKRKNQIAEKRRAKLMAQLNQQSQMFIDKNKNLYDETKIMTVSSDTQISSLERTSEPEKSGVCKTVCLGPNKTLSLVSEKSKQIYRCILCQEEEEISLNSAPMVLCCYVQSSRVLSKNRADIIEDFDNFDPLFMKNTLSWGINSTSCGHVMHAKCWQKHFDTVRITESRRNARFHGFNIKRNEYLCPLCETIGNTVLPLYPDLKDLTRIDSVHSIDDKMDDLTSPQEISRKRINLSYEDWLDGLEKTLQNSVKKELHEDKDVFIINPCPLSTITKLLADSVASNFRSLFEFDYIANANISNLLSTSVSSNQSSPTSTRPNNELKFNTELLDIMENFTRLSYTFGFSTNPNDNDPRMPISIWTNCTYTIQVIEQLLRFESKNLFSNLSLKQTELLANIVKQAALYGIYKNTESVRKSCLRLLAAILPYKSGLFDSKNIIEIDMFHLLVSLCLSMPNLYNEPKLSSVSNGGLNDLNVFKLVLQAHCVQILLTKIKYKSFYEKLKNIDDDEYPEFSTSEHQENENRIYQFYEYILNSSEEKQIFVLSEDEKRALKQSPKIIYETLKNSLMPFLRCSALFFSNLTGITTNAVISSIQDDLDKNFESIMAFLGISDDLSSLLDIKSNTFRILCESWLTTVASSSFQTKQVKIDYPMELNQFIELPNDFVDLISMSTSTHVCSSRTSSISERSAESATILCLICGEMLCSQPFCCQKQIFKKRVGCCTAHTHNCCGTSGVFLRVAECQVLLLHLNMSGEEFQIRGCFVPAPYLDDYGETDQGLRRGNPLHLCKIRYNKLYKDWLSHAIPEEISRSYQNQTNIINGNWIEF